ncbi:hypothetical protein MKK63_24375 [Methylobacterium sp. J-088]|uniref:hypothetical protein n=1 Tax=Methylobacterium sp. J-088 TaxID=2836664 RepID=UPI001FB9803A|nr:hypothetical protein [Methylobacterium sp. J-088]MCJ2065817.1 hypothetical protein [Methylobacterium sp. J-088]
MLAVHFSLPAGPQVGEQRAVDRAGSCWIGVRVEPDDFRQDGRSRHRPGRQVNNAAVASSQGGIVVGGARQARGSGRLGGWLSILKDEAGQRPETAFKPSPQI